MAPTVQLRGWGWSLLKFARATNARGQSYFGDEIDCRKPATSAPITAAPIATRSFAGQACTGKGWNWLHARRPTADVLRRPNQALLSGQDRLNRVRHQRADRRGADRHQIGLTVAPGHSLQLEDCIDLCVAQRRAHRVRRDR